MARRNIKFDLPNDECLHLYGMYGQGEDPIGIDPQRNVVRVDNKGNVLWTIQRGDPINESRWSCYVGFESLPNGALHVHASDGCVYKLNVDTGEVTFLEWEK